MIFSSVSFIYPMLIFLLKFHIRVAIIRRQDIYEEKHEDVPSPQRHDPEGADHHVGVARQAIIAIVHGRYVPSAVLTMKLAREFGKLVEEVFCRKEPTKTD